MAAMVAVGCFNPPPPPPPAKLEKNQLELHLPYDLAWEAVNAVVIKNNFHVSARDPNNGVVEAQVEHGEFTLKDADCGQIKSIAGKFSAEPAEVASAVYNFYVKATGPRTSLVTLTATFSAPVQVPFHAMRSVQCTSRGVQEARLLKQLAAQAAITRRADYETPEEAARKPAAAASPAAVSAAESILRRPQSELPAQPAGFGSSKSGPTLLGMPSLPAFPDAPPPLAPSDAPKTAPAP
jgi:hypothetical protein